jgi:Glyoxalase-like domain
LETIRRRSFIALAAGAVFAPLLTRAANEVPILLDHFILGCNDLDHGLAFVEQRTGVRAAFGGVHPSRGTRNALLSLGERLYLEIMAPDPAQQATAQISRLRELKDPAIVGWAAHPGDLEKFAAHLREASVLFDGPQPGSRQRPDGQLLHWKTLNLKDDQGGLLPFFIEWSADSLHPSADAPKGCTLSHFGAVTTKPDQLNKITNLLQLDMPVLRGDKIELQAVIIGPKGELAVSS